MDVRRSGRWLRRLLIVSCLAAGISGCQSTSPVGSVMERIGNPFSVQTSPETVKKNAVTDVRDAGRRSGAKHLKHWGGQSWTVLVDRDQTWKRTQFPTSGVVDGRSCKGDHEMQGQAKDPNEGTALVGSCSKQTAGNSTRDAPPEFTQCHGYVQGAG